MRTSSSSAASPCISPSTSSSGSSALISASATCILRADGWSLRAEARMRQQRHLGLDAEAADLLGGEQRDLGELLGGRIGVDVGVGDEHRARWAASARSSRRRCATPMRRPITWSTKSQVQPVRAERAAQHAVGLAAVDHHRADQRQAAAHLDLGVLLRHAAARGQPVVLAPVARGSARRARD